MPNKERMARGHRGNWKKRPAPDRHRGADLAAELHPGQRGRAHNTADAPADWGSDGRDEGSFVEGESRPNRNGGMRFYRSIDVADREERELRGVKALKYTWRTITGPAPNVEHGDREAARIYLLKLEAAINQGGWNTSEAAGLYLARKVWKARAEGDDPRYAEVGNRTGGLDRYETANVKMRQTIINMKKILDASGRSNGD